MAQSKTSDTADDNTAAVAQAIDLIHALQAKITELDTQASHSLADIAAKEEALGKIVLDGTDADVQKASDQIERLKSQLVTINAGQRAAQGRLDEAKVALHRLNATQQIALFRRLTTARTKTFVEIADLIQALFKAVSKARDHGSKIAAAWG